MKKIRIVTIVAMALLLVAGQAAAAEFKATMKMGSTQPTDHPYMVGAQKFADLIKQRTIGLIVINLYPSSQLGINPVHRGIIVCFNLVLGLITPPVGGVLFAVCGVSGLSPREAQRGHLETLLDCPDRPAAYHPHPPAEHLPAQAAHAGHPAACLAPSFAPVFVKGGSGECLGFCMPSGQTGSTA